MKITLKKVVIIVAGFFILRILHMAFIANGVENVNGLFVAKDALENVYFLSQIMASIFVMLGTIIAIWQYILTSREAMKLHEKEIFEMDKERVQKAIDLAGYYKDNILMKTILILHIYKKLGIYEILFSIDSQNITHFDEYEMKQNISTSDIKLIKEAPLSEKMMNALIQESEITKMWDDCKEVSIVEEDGKMIKTLKVSPLTIMHRFQTELTEILNNLEFFAMHFTHESADDSVIYQSLHQSYLETVQLLYYDIAANNIPGESKLYTNVIELYNKWFDRAKKQKESETAVARENIIKGKSLKKVDKK